MLITLYTSRELDSYIGFIKTFESELLKEHNLTGSICEYLGEELPKKGSFKSYNYKFHGIGCGVFKDEITCEYDSFFKKDSSILFSLWKFFKFIETNPDLNPLSQEEVKENINALLESGSIINFYIGDRDTGLFEVKKEYINKLIMGND
ncbi:DUF6896 domain-containing protein [Tenacibaculum agarivorans]|uniref:DUF6896 domain-containing protein n=1 Tax=Tenacibaculum agarivorans TaxID=1908389 RepID=UPI00094BBCE3|nr:hypothetical protein [Tenacibaculum agarivorans]